MTRILTTRETDNVDLQDLNYEYDAVGNIIKQTDKTQQAEYYDNQKIELVLKYKYDALCCLIKAIGRESTGLAMPTQEDFTNNIYWPDTTVNGMQNYTQRYEYDALGNMLKMKSVGDWTRGYEYDESNNYLLGHGDGMIYGYDAHGNIINMSHLSKMRWDYLDQLHSTTNGTFTSYYHCDSEGNHTRKVVKKGNICEERYYICGYKVFRKYNNNSISYERKTLNVSDDEKFFIRIETGEYSGHDIERYQYDNHLGSACLELNEEAEIISYEEYHPFGTTSYRSGKSQTEVSLKRYKYNGKEKDEETGLYYYGARYYAPWLCRFVSVDPLQYEYPNKSPYHYCSNNPVNRVDPNGMSDESKVEPHVAVNDNIVAPKVDLHEKIPTEPAGFDSGTGTEQNPIELPELEIVGEKKYNLEFGSPTYGTGLFQAIKMTAKHIGESIDLKEFGISLSGNNLVHGILTLMGDILDVFGFDILNKFRSSKEESQPIEEVQAPDNPSLPANLEEDKEEIKTSLGYVLLGDDKAIINGKEYLKNDTLEKTYYEDHYKKKK